MVPRDHPTAPNYALIQSRNVVRCMSQEVAQSGREPEIAAMSVLGGKADISHPSQLGPLLTSCPHANCRREGIRIGRDIWRDRPIMAERHVM